MLNTYESKNRVGFAKVKSLELQIEKISINYDVSKNIINITMLMSAVAIVIGIYYKINKYSKVDTK